MAGLQNTTGSAPRNTDPDTTLVFRRISHATLEGRHRHGRQLFHDVKEKGYAGSYSNLERLLGAWRRVEKPTPKNTARVPPKLEPVKDSLTGHLISPVIAAALCIKPRGSLTTDQARKVDAVKDGSDVFYTMRSLATRFKGILRGAHSELLEPWITVVSQSFH